MQRFVPNVEDLSDVPRLTEAALVAARWNPEVGCLIDRVRPGRPLVDQRSALAEGQTDSPYTEPVAAA